MIEITIRCDECDRAGDSCANSMTACRRLRARLFKIGWSQSRGGGKSRDFCPKCQVDRTKEGGAT